LRIRSTKPEFWRSHRIASVDWDARLVLKGLESYVDDNGVGKDDLALIVADVFPRDLSRNPTGTLQKVSEAISQLNEAGLVWRYDDEGTQLLYIAFWESIQRIEKPTKGRFRRPDGTFNYRDSVIGASLPEPSRNVPVTLQPGTEEQGNRGTGEALVTLRSDASPVRETSNVTSRIVNGWLNSIPANKRPPARTVNDATNQIAAMVREGIEHGDIAKGLAEWWAGKYPPSTLPNYVARAQQGQTGRTATGTTRAMQTLDLARQLEQEES
jgi:hypothetical protein